MTEQPSTASDVPVQQDDRDDELASSRAQNARRAFLAAVGSIVLLPLDLFATGHRVSLNVISIMPGLILLPYSTWLLCKVFNSKEHLERKFRRLAIGATAINLLVLFVGFFVIASLFVATNGQVDPLDFAHPRELVGSWKDENNQAELVLSANGKMRFRCLIPPEQEFSGTWGLADFQFLYYVRRVQKGDGKDRIGRTFAWGLDHFTAEELVVSDSVRKCRFLRK